MSQTNQSVDVELTHNVMPTYVALSPDHSNFVFGEEAKVANFNGRSSAKSFKQVIGASPTEFDREGSFWMTPTGLSGTDIKTFSARDVVRAFLKNALSDLEEGSQIIIGIPAILDEAWMNNYKEHIRQVVEDIGLERPLWLYEPFAVYQYYRSMQSVEKTGTQTVLVVDVGGGTFNSSLIRTTQEGTISRSGSHSVPLGLMAEFCGGDYFDRELLKGLVNRLQLTGVQWKDEDPLSRLETKGCSSVLQKVEVAKIALSRKVRSKKKNDGEPNSVTIFFEEGSLHPEESIQAELTEADLNDVVEQLWSSKWSLMILETLEKAFLSLGEDHPKLDLAIVSGGSSNLPFFVDHLYKCLRPYTTKNRIKLVKEPEFAVAQGIAQEAFQLSRKHTNLSSHTVGPVLLGDLYIRARRSRTEPYLKVETLGKTRSRDGLLFRRPSELENSAVNLQLTLPFSPHDRVFFSFFDGPTDSASQINVDDYVVNVPFDKGRAQKKVTLSLEFIDHETIKPTMTFLGRSNNKRKLEKIVPLNELFYEELQVGEGKIYFGLDFGNSNTYLTRHLEATGTDLRAEKPEYKIAPYASKAASRVEKRLYDLQSVGKITNQHILEYATKQAPNFVYHSSKLELIDVEHEDTIEISSLDENDLSKSELEAKGLANSYRWMIENVSLIDDSFSAFASHAHKISTEDWLSSAGKPRTKLAKATGGIDYPHPSEIQLLSSQLATSFKTGPVKSLITFAAENHAWFETIHPFDDGNGRVGRVLLDAILIKNQCPPMLIRSDDRERYLEALSCSNQGSLSQLVHLFSELLDVSIDNFLHSMTTPTQDHTPSRIDDMAKVLLEADDPLEFILSRYEEQRRSNAENVYQDWALAHQKLLDEVGNIGQSYESFDLSFELKDYTLPSVETFSDVYNRGQSVRDWWFGITIRYRKYSENVLFIIESNTDVKSEVKCSVQAYRVTDEGPKKLDAIESSLYFYSGNRLQSGLNAKGLEFSLRHFFAALVYEHFGTDLIAR